MSTKSQHAETLNALDQMQESGVYALMRSVLADAECIIVSQEKEISRLEREVEELTKEVRNMSAFIHGVGA